MYVYKHIEGTKYFDANGKEVESGDVDLKNAPIEVIRKVLANFKPVRDENLRITKQKVRESVDFSNLITQAVNNIQDLEKVNNLLSKRAREWYELYNPEISRKITNHETFIELILTKSKTELLKELDVKYTMGADLEEKDIDEILLLAKSIQELFELKNKHTIYLDDLMEKNCKNIKAIAGTLLGAKLLAMAGSLRRLAFMPASTIQLLGAEKALFRHLKTKSRSPKHGIIISHTFVQKSKNKGRMARMLADKISLSAKIDLFGGSFIGDKYYKELELKCK